MKIRVIKKNIVDYENRVIQIQAKIDRLNESDDDGNITDVIDLRQEKNWNEGVVYGLKIALNS